MFSLLRSRARDTDTRFSGTSTVQNDAWLRPASVEELLSTPRRRVLLEHIWQRTSLSREQFAQLYRAPLERYASLAQLLPASAAHHHAYSGGMLDHGLEIVAFALKLRQSRLLPVGAPSETQAAQAEAWSAAAAYAALLHDVGKLAVNFLVEHTDGSRWYPWHGPLTREYRFRHLKQEYRLHEAAAGLLYTRILDSRILDWLSGFPELWSSLLYVLAGQHDRAGVLGELVTQADKASVAQDLGGDPMSAQIAPTQALQRKLLDGLRYLVKEELKLNQPQASDGWLTDDALWLISKTVCDKLRAHLLSHGIEGIPDRNPAVFNVLQDHGIVQATPNGKAIWTATVTSSGGWSHSFTFLRIAPTMIWGNSERPASFNGTVRIDSSLDTADPPADAGAEITAAAPISQSVAGPEPLPAESSSATSSVDDLLAMFEEPCAATAPSAAIEAESPAAPMNVPEPLDAAATPRSFASDVDAPSGEHFVAWLRERILNRMLIINDAKAMIHIVDGTVFLVSPGIFQRYAKEHPQVGQRARADNVSEWQWVQKRFEKLRLHKKQNSGLNIWICEVTGPRRTRNLHGYLLKDALTLFSDIPLDNPYLRLSALE